MTLPSNTGIPDMRVRGQLTCLDVKKENKKRDYKLNMYIYICIYIHIYIYTFMYIVSCRAPIMPTCVILQGDLCVLCMHRWNEQLFDNRNWGKPSRGGQHSPIMRKESCPRARQRWTHLRGAAEDSCSSIYECDIVNS